MSSNRIRIIRGPCGEVEVNGAVDAFAAAVLTRAGFESSPTLRGSWIRLPFDMGRDWENEHAAWAADMLTAARYPVDLDPDLRPAGDAAPTRAVRRNRTVMKAQPPPPASRRLPRR